MAPCNNGPWNISDKFVKNKIILAVLVNMFDCFQLPVFII